MFSSFRFCACLFRACFPFFTYIIAHDVSHSPYYIQELDTIFKLFNFGFISDYRPFVCKTQFFLLFVLRFLIVCCCCFQITTSTLFFLVVSCPNSDRAFFLLIFAAQNRQNYVSYLLVIYGARSIYFKNEQRKQRTIFSISAIKQQGRFFSCLGLFHVELETKHQYPTLQFFYYILTCMFGDTFSITSSLPVFSASLNSSILFSLYRCISSCIISYIIPYTILFIIPIIIFITIPLLLSLLFFAIPVWFYQRA